MGERSGGLSEDFASSSSAEDLVEESLGLSEATRTSSDESGSKLTADSLPLPLDELVVVADVSLPELGEVLPPSLLLW